MIKKYDIVVVGAGPAGCTFIKNLDDKYRILLLDRQEIPGSKVCGGLLTEETIQYFTDHHLEIPNYVYSHPKKLKKMYVNLDRNEEKNAGFVYNINRDHFNHWMYTLIQKKIDVAETTSLKKIHIAGKKIMIEAYNANEEKNQTISCDYLIGADGVLSRVRKELKAPVTSKYMALQEYGDLEEEMDCLLFFYSKKLLDHFIWLMPKADTFVIGLPLPYTHGEIINTDTLNQARKIVENYLKIKIKCYQRDGFLVTIPKSQDELFLGKNNVLLIGESAGWISARSGDGISFALRSAEHCAQAFNEPSKNILETYKMNSQSLKKEFDEKLESFLKIQQKIKEYKKLHNL